MIFIACYSHVTIWGLSVGLDIRKAIIQFYRELVAWRRFYRVVWWRAGERGQRMRHGQLTGRRRGSSRRFWSRPRAPTKRSSAFLHRVVRVREGGRVDEWERKIVREGRCRRERERKWRRESQSKPEFEWETKRPSLLYSLRGHSITNRSANNSRIQFGNSLIFAADYHSLVLSNVMPNFPNFSV